MVTGDDVRNAAASVVALLTPAVDTGADFDVPAGALEWSCHKTLAHSVDCVLWYAANLVRRSTSSAGSPDVGTETAAKDLVDSMTSAGAMLALVVDSADAAARGWHPAGMADASGFAGMGCDEILVHGYDIATGLGLKFAPPPDVVGRTLRRLFPWAPVDADPWAALLWANGREPLGDVAPPGDEWLWWCAPLAEWDGTTIPRWTG